MPLPLSRPLLALAAVLLGACTDRSATGVREPVPADAPERAASVAYRPAHIEGVPHVLQQPDFCGEATVEMYTAKLGRRFSQEQVFALSGMDPSRGMGATTRELRTALERIGFRPGPVWHTVRAADEAGIEAEFASLHADLMRGVPSIVCTRFDERPDTTEHFRLVLGYDPSADEVLYHDPAVADGANLRMARRTFFDLWPLAYEAGRWTLIRLALEGDELGQPPDAASAARLAALAQHVRTLRAKLPPEFSVRVEPPFVVVGNGGPEAVERSAEGTVRWAVRLLKQDYFTVDPPEILDIYLFQDAASYDRYRRQWFGGGVDTPYGFYSAEQRALVMNIATGGGTLVHEIVHPFVRANFPNCPAWFNEGLGSLYEQAASRDGHIVGLTNWRLAGLQKAIRQGRVPTFAELTRTTDGEFYDEDRGTNYAQARYLLYYLQERDLLRDYYRAFHARKLQDPTGYQTLQAVLGHPDMREFQRDWERYVLALTFP